MSVRVLVSLGRIDLAAAHLAVAAGGLPADDGRVEALERQIRRISVGTRSPDAA